MFIYNNCKYDARVLKEAKSLAEAGYDVRVIAVLDKTTEPYEERDGFRIIRVVKDPLHYRILRGVKGFKLIAFLTSILHAIMQILLLSIKKLKKFLAFLTSTFVLIKNQLIAKMHYGLMSKLKHVFQKIDQAIKEKRLKKYIRESIKTYPGRFLSVDWALLLGYYSYQGMKKALYWSIRRPMRILWSFLYKQLRNFLMIFHKLLSFLDYYQRSLEIVRQEPADIYHAHDLNTLPVAYWAKRLTGGKIVYDSHELYVERNKPKPSSNVGKYLVSKIEAFLIHRSDVVITVNESIAKELARRYGIRTPHVIMNTPLLATDPCRDQNYSLRVLLRIPYCYKLILYSGGITFGRGLAQVIKSLRYLPFCYFVMMGYGLSDYIEYLKRIAKEQGVSSRISFFGPVPSKEVVLFASSADLGIAPIENVCLSYYYCSPNKVFEYILAGLPVVASNFPELKRIVEGYNLGKTFNPEDPKDIAAAINDVLSDKARYEEMRKNALEAAKVFNWENESKKLLAIYRNLSEVIQNDKRE